MEGAEQFRDVAAELTVLTAVFQDTERLGGPDEPCGEQGVGHNDGKRHFFLTGFCLFQKPEQ